MCKTWAVRWLWSEPSKSRESDHRAKFRVKRHVRSMFARFARGQMLSKSTENCLLLFFDDMRWQNTLYAFLPLLGSPFIFKNLISTSFPPSTGAWSLGVRRGASPTQSGDQSNLRALPPKANDAVPCVRPEKLRRQASSLAAGVPFLLVLFALAFYLGNLPSTDFSGEL